MAEKHRQRLLDTSALVVGYAMSRLDKLYLRAFNHRTWRSALDEASQNLGVPSASIKNLRDEFDPLHANQRRGWHRRPLRKSRQRVLAELCEVSDIALIELVVRIFQHDRSVLAEAVLPLAQPRRIISNIAERLLTGRRAEEFFLENCTELVGFPSARIIDRREEGCGFDFSVDDQPQTAIEVKGIKRLRGEVLFTDREWREASLRKDRYLVVVVGNVASDPVARVFRDPSITLPAACRYQQTVTALWIAKANIA